MPINSPFPVTPLFEWNYTAKEQTIINQGGTNSGKTYSILQVLCMRAIETPKTIITVTSDTLPSLKTGALRDMDDIVNSIPFFENELLSVNKTDKIYYFKNRSFIEFKVFPNEILAQKGGKRDYLFVNEPNRYPYKIFEQLWLRTNKQTFIDYNPRVSFWVHDKLIGEKNVKLLLSNYTHNGHFDKDGNWKSFVGASTIEKIESNKIKGFDADGNIIDDYAANMWNVYGLGKTGQLSGVVFPNVRWVSELPTENIKRVGYGLDFGYNDPTVLVKLVLSQGQLFAKCLLYESELTNQQIAKRFEALGLKKGLRTGDLIVCDSSEPKSIKELRKLNWRCKACIKGEGSILTGIKKLKSYGTLNFVSNKHVKEEQRNYIWKVNKIDGRTTEQPEDNYNHFMDALRYGEQSLSKKRSITVSYSK